MASRAASWIATILLAGMGFVPDLSYAQTNPEHEPSSSDFGGIGLMQTRTARFARDGQFDVGYSFVYPYERYLLSIQALPWLEATFRYTSVRGRDFDGNAFSGRQQNFKDRGADLKFHIFRETKYRPSVAVGLQDSLGTGIFAGEYVVASKRYFDFDFSFGIGWGYSAGAGHMRNPLRFVSPKFENRGANAQRTGGTVVFGNWFRGERAGLFGGVEWATPLKGLSAKLEYDPNDYRSEPLNIRSERFTPWNIGLNYRPFPWIETLLAFERGKKFMGRLSLRTNFHDPGLPKLDPPPPPLRPRPLETEAPAPAEAAGRTLLYTETVRPVSPEQRVDPARQRNLGSDQILQPGFQPPELVIAGARADLRSASGRIELRPGPDQGVQMAARARPAGVEIRSLPPVGESVAEPLRVSRVGAEDNFAVSSMFAALDALGVEVSEFAISGAAAVVQIEGERGNSDHEAIATAVFRTGPVALETVQVSDFSGRGSIFRRENFETTEALKLLFNDFESKGIEILSVDLTDSEVTFQVADRSGLWLANASDATRSVERLLPVSVQNVSFVAPPQFVEEALPGLEGTPMLPTRANGLAGLPADTPTMDRAAVDRLFQELEDEEFVVDGIYLEGSSATLYVGSTRFRQVARNVGRAARVAHNNVPASIEHITIVLVTKGMELTRITMRRRELEKAVAAQGSIEEIMATGTIEGPKKIFMPPGTIKKRWRYPRFLWSIAPTVRSHIGSRESFYLYQLQLELGAAVEVWKGLEVAGLFGRNIYNNFDRITTRSPSRLPKVRSDIKEYLQQGHDNVVHLQANYFFMVAPNVYTRVSWGIFEEMYGGYGGEVLYRPYGSRVAAGVDINWVRQRDFDQKFTYRNYKVTTGHVNLYWDIPFHGVLVEAHIGQYLAADRGATFQISRLFDSGVKAGAWATFTDVSFRRFGEGAFDKGFFVSLPFELFFTRSSTQRGAFSFRPLTKDGGQRLTIRPRLYDMTSGVNLDSVLRDWPTLLD